MNPKNKYGIPTEKWNRLGENQEAFNQVYGKCMKQKSTYLKELTVTQRNQLTAIIDKVIAQVCETAVSELQTA